MQIRIIICSFASVNYMKTYKETLLILIPTLAIFAGIIWLASPSSAEKQTAVVSQSVKDTLAAVGESSFDFGEISMAKGRVSKIFTVKNSGSEPVMIERMYTSCMCTSATLILNGARTGPLGMAGHGYIPRIKKEIPAGGQAEVEVIFDPAAHGPAGVGPIRRAVTLESSAGNLDLEISALVKP